MKIDRAKSPATPDPELHPELDSENGEFDFSAAPRPGRDPRYEAAQGRFYEVSDAEHRRRACRRRTPPDARD
jgi:hypothetical protein